ncbi:hypothetical protein BpHYR1_016069 [Brachionus plicatilis]|uniref:Uncharacterized protein n=1 Tax=Brachionus plicatilis TaxID=10195 RepID=A0A3M7SAB2_BRAPC|nr:hypothetical protein BpHYR1_016069 [Brachionus plicatilis]
MSEHFGEQRFAHQINTRVSLLQWKNVIWHQLNKSVHQKPKRVEILFLVVEAELKLIAFVHIVKNTRVEKVELKTQWNCLIKAHKIQKIEQLGRFVCLLAHALIYGQQGTLKFGHWIGLATKRKCVHIVSVGGGRGAEHAVAIFVCFTFDN